jgi:hypothetical protein
MSKEYVFLNYSQTSNLPADQVPTLIPSHAMTALLNGDKDPFYKVETIEYPVKGTGGIYTESFFESFANRLNSLPIAGSKEGHGWKDRGDSDIYTVGARLDKNGDGTGKIHFKIYFPANGEKSSNEALIRDAKAGIVHFSLVTLPEYTVTCNQDGSESRTFIASKGYERNDAVEHGTGAMKQTVNSQKPETIRELERSLRDLGYSNKEAVAIASKGFGSAKIENTEERDMDKESVLAWLKTNSGIPLAEIAQAMGQSDKLANTAELESLKVTNSKLTADLASVADERRKNKLDAEFGATGALRDMAQMVMGNSSIEELDAKMVTFKASEPAKQLAANSADYRKQVLQTEGGSSPAKQVW